MELPSTHPAASFGGQVKLLAKLAWRWLLAGIVGQISGVPVLGLILGFALMHQLLRSWRTQEFWSPYLADMKPAQLWLARLGFLALICLGLWDHWDDDKMIPYTAAWAGLLAAFILETFAISSLKPKPENPQ